MIGSEKAGCFCGVLPMKRMSPILCSLCHNKGIQDFVTSRDKFQYRSLQNQMKQMSAHTGAGLGKGRPATPHQKSTRTRRQYANRGTLPSHSSTPSVWTHVGAEIQYLKNMLKPE